MATPIPENRARFTLSELLAATGGQVTGPLEDAALEVHGVSTDSRTLERGQAFVALQGERFDGHEHLAAVRERGAALAIVERDVRCEGLTTLRVGSTLEALGKLASVRVERWRARGRGRVVALTGSAGKTTTKGAIAALLEARNPGKVVATAGNLNNLVGVPMTLLALPDAAELAVLEMGTNAPGEIGRLARMARPDVAIVTLIASAHSEGLGGLEGIAREKTAMFRDLDLASVALGNADDARVVAGLDACGAGRKITYGEHAGADYRILARSLSGVDRARLEIRRPDGATLAFETPLLGVAGALATAAALATVEALFPDRPLDAQEIEAALAPLASQGDGPGRLRPRTFAGGFVVIDDSYNANPASCRASIAAASELAASLGRRLVLVLGEMRELGADRDSAHDELGDRAVESGARWLVAVGPLAKRTAERAAARGLETHHAETAEEATLLAGRLVGRRDLVLVKGSRGVRTEQVVAALASIPIEPPSVEEGSTP